AKSFERCRTDAVNLDEIVDLAKAAMLKPIFLDSLGQAFSNPRKLEQLRPCRLVEIHTVRNADTALQRAWPGSPAQVAVGVHGEQGQQRAKQKRKRELSGSRPRQLEVGRLCLRRGYNIRRRCRRVHAGNPM